MPTPAAAARLIRFDAFELDLRTTELRKCGARLRLQGQPLQLLTLLLQDSGNLVTRAELRNHLWPADTLWISTTASTTPLGEFAKRWAIRPSHPGT
jgi:DNA-binding response OmpR family regulator